MANGDRFDQAQHDARREAAPFVGLAAAALVALGATSAVHDWQLFAEGDWWVWIVLALPAAVLAVVFLLGLGRLGMSSSHRRRVAVALLGLLAAANLAGIGLVIGSLVSGRGAPTGAQLLASAGAVVLVNVITFGLIFWELDCGGPISRALADSRLAPDFQFPQDENPQLAAPGWAPALNDYLYLALTNAVAFSPTDAMPLTHRAKLFMGIESMVSALTVLVVAARAVNILGA
jgi:hypothetical protein